MLEDDDIQVFARYASQGSCQIVIKLGCTALNSYTICNGDLLYVHIEASTEPLPEEVSYGMRMSERV